MDLSLATDSYPYHNHLLQQQQQQQHHHHHHQQQQQQQQQQLQLQHHYPYNQHPQTLSLAPPSGKGLFDLNNLDHSSHNSLALGHLPASSSDYNLQYVASNATTASSSATNVPPLHQSNLTPAQTWSRNPSSAHNSALSGNLPAHSAYLAQHSEYSPAVAATSTAATLYPGGYKDAHGGDHALQYSFLYEWSGHDLRRSQRPQQNWDACLPPGVEPIAAPAPISISQPHPQQQLYTQQDPFAHPYQSFGVNVRTTRPIPKLRPKKKEAKNTEKKISVVKTTATKQAGASQGGLLEKGPGWCFVCQRNCVTEVALKQHLDGKPHKRQVERQSEKTEAAIKIVNEAGGGVATMLEQMWVQVSMMGKPLKTKKKPKAEGGPKNVPPVNATKKQLETIRCELCNVDCNSQTILEIHFGGRKHAARLKKLQKSSVACKAEPTPLMGQ